MVNYGYKVKGVEVNSDATMDRGAYYVTVMTEKHKKEELFRAKWVLVDASARLNVVILYKNAGL